MKNNMEEKELCEHKWKLEEKFREFVGRAGNAFMGGSDHFKIVYIQKCEKCDKLNRV